MEFITSKEYRERPSYLAEKQTMRDIDIDERKVIMRRMLSRSPFDRSCPVCGDEQTTKGFCCIGCQNTGHAIIKFFGGNRKNIIASLDM